MVRTHSVLPEARFLVLRMSAEPQPYRPYGQMRANAEPGEPDPEPNPWLKLHASFISKSEITCQTKTERQSQDRASPTEGREVAGEGRGARDRGAKEPKVLHDSPQPGRAARYRAFPNAQWLGPRRRSRQGSAPASTSAGANRKPHLSHLFITSSHLGSAFRDNGRENHTFHKFSRLFHASIFREGERENHTFHRFSRLFHA